MKRLMALAALVALAVPSLVYAQNAGSTMVWKQIEFRSQRLGADGLAKSLDSTYFSINAASTAETTAALMLEDWTPGPWRGGTGVIADSMFAFVVVIAPLPGASTTAGADSFYAKVQASVGGANWHEFIAEPGAPHGIAEIGTSNNYMLAFYTAGGARLDADGVGANPMFFPVQRLIIRGDASAANTGQFIAKIGYFRGNRTQVVP